MRRSVGAVNRAAGGHVAVLRRAAALAAAVFISLHAVAAEAVITNLTTSSTIESDLGFFGNATKSEAIVSTAPNTFTVRFGLILYRAGFGPQGHPSGFATADYLTNFSVLSSGNYDMTITVYRAGELRREDLIIAPSTPPASPDRVINPTSAPWRCGP